MPYSIAEPALQRWHEYVDALHALLAEDRRSDAFELFMRMAGASDDMVAEAKSSPVWPGCEAIAPTLAYDAACLGDGQPPAARLAAIAQPTLVATGGASPDSFVGGGGSFFDEDADTIAAAVPPTHIGRSSKARPMPSTRKRSRPCFSGSSRSDWDSDTCPARLRCLACAP